MKRQHILIELETLVDTTFAVALGEFSEKLGELDFNQYRHRIHDRMWELLDIPAEQWQQAWDSRNLNTLKIAKPTAMMLELCNILSTPIINGINRQIWDPVELFINTYPFALSSDEKAELVDAVAEFLPIPVKTHIVYIPAELFTPQYIKENFDIVIIRSLQAWMEKHSKALATTRMPTVSFYYPSLLADSSDAILESIAKGTDASDPFMILQNRLAEYLTLQVMDIVLFSLVDPDHFAEYLSSLRDQNAKPHQDQQEYQPVQK